MTPVQLHGPGSLGSQPWGLPLRHGTASVRSGQPRRVFVDAFRAAWSCVTIAHSLPLTSTLWLRPRSDALPRARGGGVAATWIRP